MLKRGPFWSFFSKQSSQNIIYSVFGQLDDKGVGNIIINICIIICDQWSKICTHFLQTVVDQLGYYWEGNRFKTPLVTK